LAGGHIFISYPHTETEFTARLAADLKNSGVQVWMDVLEDGIRSGDDWRQSIEKGLDTAAAIIPIICPDYVNSKYCRNELARADGLNLNAFPILLRTVEKKEWPIEIQRHQYTDFKEWRAEALYQKQLKTILDVLKRDSAEQIGEIPAAETQYLTRLIAELESRKGVLEYVDLGGQMDEPTRPKPRLTDEWGLEGSFALLEQQSAQPQDNETRGKKQTLLDDIRAAVEKHPRFVLIGDPGAGKTTTLRRLALDAARARLANPKTASLPLLLFLPTWDNEAAPADFVRVHLAGEGLRPSPTENMALYLDGLNEMGGTGTGKAGKLREWLATNDAPEHVIVTCRAGDYARDLDLKLPTVLAGAMDEARIRQFAQNYLSEDAGKFLERILPNTWERDREDSLFRLVANPYLLTALMIVYMSSPDRELPRNNGALFRRLVMALWERERLRQTVGWVPFADMEARYAKLAYWMIENELPTEVPFKYALNHVESESLIQAGAAANLITVSDGQVRFYHQLMQEYFAAVVMQSLDVKKKLLNAQTALRNRPSGTSFETAYHLFRQWEQVIIALCGISPNPDTIVIDVGTVDLFLALKCMSSDIRLSQSVYERIVTGLVDYLRTHIHEYEPVSTALDPVMKQVYPALAHYVNDQDWRIWMLVTDKMIARADQAELEVHLLRAVDDPRWQVRKYALTTLIQRNCMDENFIETLLKMLDSETPAPDPRLATLYGAMTSDETIIQPKILAVDKFLGKDLADIFEFEGCISRSELDSDRTLHIVHEFQPDVVIMDDWSYRSEEIVGEIKRAFPDLPIFMLFLRVEKTQRRKFYLVGIVDSDDKPFDTEALINRVMIATASEETLGMASVRQDAARYIGKVDSHRAVPILSKCIHDFDMQLRQSALSALAEIGSREAVSHLLEAAHHSDRKIASNAQQAIALVGKSESVDQLIQALTAADENFRKNIIAALSHIRNDKIPAVLIPILDDPEESIRQLAVNGLEYQGTPETLTIAVDYYLPRLANTETIQIRDQTEWKKMRVCDHAAQSLERIATSEALEAVQKWREQQEDKH
jgi:CheY-like chemotaxis protein